ncbi:mevalonate kinase [Paracrocinitomix mangrovi]|uniref:GHMP family kinase ATP-binding protein n=1 Tax=Paracrocinitomix mangrovi TaxID=2862509 RepID=UPI001C8EFEA8|nr:mevalonate kinase [Paracrocinitomix mangrovi]UKN02490.1 mevalonate kinase [Paracrocinitomix mangrovi]
MEKFTSKVLLFGEYSLLYDSMALTMPFDKFSGQFSYADTAIDAIQAAKSNQGLRKFCTHILDNHTDEQFKLNVQKFKTELDKGLFFESNIPQGFGLGSSGALVAAIFLRYLDKAGDFKDELKVLTKEKIKHLKATLGGLEGYFHGTSSGIDPLSILINEPLLVKSNFEIVPVKVPTYKPEGKHVVFLLNTGLSRNTDKLVGQFKASASTAEFKNKLECQLTPYTNDGINNFLNANTDELYLNLYNLVKFQHGEMNYLIPEKYLDTVSNGLDSGDYFLKICGAGGGGYMLGFTQNWESTQEQLQGEDLEVLYRF